VKSIYKKIKKNKKKHTKNIFIQKSLKKILKFIFLILDLTPKIEFLKKNRQFRPE
jgi:hypothetical protein